MTRFLTGFLVGGIYSTLLISSGPHLFHFLPRIGLAQTIYYSLLVALIFYFVDSSKTFLYRKFSLFGMVLGSHFFVWLYYFSFLNYFSRLVTISYSIAIACVLYFGIHYSVKPLLNYTNENRFIVIGIIVFIIVARLLLSIILPHSLVIETAVNTFYESQSITVFFPFSLSLNRAINIYDEFLPKIPPGRKMFVLTMDAFRGDFLGKSLGNVEVTPNLSDYAENHVYFPNYRVQANATKPSVASFFTGKYVREHGVYKFISPSSDAKGKGKKNQPAFDHVQGHVMSDRFRTLAERLQSEGYKTAGYVKIGHIFRKYKYDQGFDLYTKAGGTSPSSADLSTLNASIFWLLREQPRNAFIYFHIVGPHFPYPMGARNRSFWRRTQYKAGGRRPQQQWSLGNFSNRLQNSLPADKKLTGKDINFLKHFYAADLNYYDRFVFPRFVDSLRGLGVYDEGMFVVTSDHGENLYDHNRWYGHARYLYDEEIRVPAIVKLPIDVKSSVSKSFEPKSMNVESVDLTASILDHAGADTSGISGHSFMPRLLSGDQSADFSVSISEEPRAESIRYVSVVEDQWKLIWDYKEQNGELYNLNLDPKEQNPVKNRPNLKDRLLSMVRKRLGKGNDFLHGTAYLKGADQEDRANLEGLGYF